MGGRVYFSAGRLGLGLPTGSSRLCWYQWICYSLCVVPPAVPILSRSLWG